MRVLVIQHDEDKPIGRLEEPLRAEGFDLDVRFPGSEPVAFEDHVAVVGLSGFADPVDETDAVRATRDVFRVALEEGRPALGICLGAQLLAQAAGAVAGLCKAEYGYAPVTLTKATSRDRLLAGLPSRIEVFHAHNYAVCLPAGASSLAETTQALQAFHLAPAAWGFQFHPEPTVGIVDTWIASHGEILRSHGVEPAQVGADARRLDDLARDVAEVIGRRFAKIVRERAGASFATN